MATTAEVVFEHCHTALKVRDLEAQIKFFTEVVGLKVDRVGGDAARPTGVWMQALQLVRDENLDTANKGVLDHIGIAVGNIEEIMASLVANNVTIEMPISDRSRPGVPLRIAFFRDPENNRIELTDRT